MHERNQTMGHKQTITHSATQNVCIMYHISNVSGAFVICQHPALLRWIQPRVHGDGGGGGGGGGI